MREEKRECSRLLNSLWSVSGLEQGEQTNRAVGARDCRLSGGQLPEAQRPSPCDRAPAHLFPRVRQPAGQAGVTALPLEQVVVCLCPQTQAVAPALCPQSAS